MAANRDDEPAAEEIRAFLRHPLTQKLNRELIEAFEKDHASRHPLPPADRGSD